MKNNLLLLISLLFINVTKAQNNVFPSSSNAGIGTSSPVFNLGGSSTGLHILGYGGSYATINLQRGNNAQGSIIDFSSATNGLQFRLGTNYFSGGDKFHIATASAIGFTMDNSGNIGIGTSSPAERLTVLDNNDAQGAGLYRNYSAASNAGIFLNFGALDVSASKIIGASILGQLNGNKTSGELHFYTKTASSLMDRMVIDQNGNIGIGTTSPGSKLEVSGNIFTTSQNNYIQFGTSASTAPYVAGDVSGNLSLGTQNTSKLLVSASGNVAIGTSTPAAKLHIYSPAGNGAVRGLLVDASVSGGAIPFDIGYDNGGVHKSLMLMVDNGNVGIGTISPAEKLSVNGNISAKKLVITQTGWSDYVFDSDYKLRSLQSLEAYINENKHLPEVPTTREVGTKGISIGDNQALLLKKIEELTLYMIKLNKRQEFLEKRNEIQQKEIEQLKSVISKYNH